jgi:hypothetical protein
MLEILEATQEAYGYLPVAALKRISFATGAWYAQIYGTATSYEHLRVGAPGEDRVDDAIDSGAFSAALGATLKGTAARPPRLH